MQKIRSKTSYLLLTMVLCFVIFLAIVFLFFPGGEVLAENSDIFGVDYGAGSGLTSVDIRVAAIRVIRTVLGILGIIALGLLIYGGVVWMTSGGNPQKIELAKKILLNTLIGLIIILLAFAIVQYVFKILEGSQDDGGFSCSPGVCYGCQRCLSDGVNLITDLSCSSCKLPPPIPSRFELQSMQTSHVGTNEKKDVYTCSRVQAIFNRNIDANTISQNNDLKIVAEGGSVNGSFTTFGNVLIFTPPGDPSEFPNKGKKHEYYLPTSIQEDSNDQLSFSACSLGAECDVAPPPYARWDFEVGLTGDLDAPQIVGTYPRNDLANPDMNVSMTPIIDVTFNENIDITTLAEIEIDPITHTAIYYAKFGNIYLKKIDAQGNELNIIDNHILLVELKENGFIFYLREPNTLEEFSIYQITVQGIRDLCGNEMVAPVSWQFMTNNTGPGIAGYYPTGDNVCPDTRVSVNFNTSMFRNRVEMTILSSRNSQVIETWNYRLVAGQISSADEHGEFKVMDNSQPNDYKVFVFIPAVGLSENTNYHISVVTDKIINIGNDLLVQSWDFEVTDLANCVCSPHIDYLSKNQGPAGDCLTINGQCFKGTVAKPAEISDIFFNSENAVIPDVSNYSDYSVGTTVPIGLQYDPLDNSNNWLDVSVEINYLNGGDVLSSNSNEFLLTSGQANGPCLWSIMPDNGDWGDTVRLTGIRFLPENVADATTLTIHNIVFNSGVSATILDLINNWTSTEISGVEVPENAQDGEVIVRNDQGNSNGVYFDVTRCGDGVLNQGEECDTNILNGRTCHDLGYAGGRLACYPADSEDPVSLVDISCTFDRSSCSDAPEVVESDVCAIVCRGGTNDGQACFVPGDCPSGACLIGELPSPNPRRDAVEVCLNSQIAARFTTSVVIDTDDIRLGKCANDACSSLDPVNFILSYVGDDNFILRPAVLLAGSQYQVTITTGVKSKTTGIAMQNDYIFRFTTKSSGGNCPLESVYVEPSYKELGSNASYLYKASALGPDCAIIGELQDYDWEWNIEEADNLGVAITNMPDDSEATVKSSTKQGIVHIKATAEEKYNIGTLKVDFDSCIFDITICANPDKNTVGDECPGSECDIVKDRCTPTILDFSPVDGAIGTWVSIQGCYFGDEKGQVIFADDKPANDLPAYCGNFWNDKRIIIEVPEDTAPIGPFRVVTKSGLSIISDHSVAAYPPILKEGFIVNNTIRPGLCVLDPDRGKFDDQIVLRGKNFGDVKDTGDNVVFMDDLNAQIGENVDNLILWENTEITAIVPSGVESGAVYVVKNSVNSNDLMFIAEAIEGVGTPCDGNTGETGCQANADICTVINHNLFCDANDCTCQAKAPTILDNSPLGSNVCRNAIVRATFDQEMNFNSIGKDTFIIEKYFQDEVSADFFWSKIARFFKKIFYESIYAEELVAGSINLDNINKKTVVTFTPYKLFGKTNEDTNYKVTIKGNANGVKSSFGTAMANDYSWIFSVSKEVCDIDYVQVNIKLNSAAGEVSKIDAVRDYFTCAGRNDCPDDIDPHIGNQHRYFAEAYDQAGTLLQADFVWKENNNSGKNLISLPSSLDTPIIEVTSEKNNGSTTLIVTASDFDTSDDIHYATSTQAVSITNFICQNPWPSFDIMFPFEDSDRNCKLSGYGDCYDMKFSTFYCRDFGYDENYCADSGLDCDDDADCPGSTCQDAVSDDLPALSAVDTVISGEEANGTCVQGGNHDQSCANDADCPNGYCKKVLKDFVFYFPAVDSKWCSNSLTPCIDSEDCVEGDVCERNTDIISVKVYSNNEHLSASAWYKKYMDSESSYASTKIDGYDAVVFDRETYINAAVDNNPQGAHNIWTDIFRISYSVKKDEVFGQEESANPITREVFDRFYKNFVFNYNLGYNLQLCAGTNEWCTKDSDCDFGIMCVAPKDKLARDVVRMGAIGEMVYYLDLYRGYCSKSQDLSCLSDEDCPDYNISDPSSEICISYRNGSYPILDAGTYIKGQSVSIWDSWQATFSGEINASLLLDPINEGSDCPNDTHNGECWNEQTKKFKCEPGSHMFHYVSLENGLVYNIFTNMEYSNTGWKPDNANYASNFSEQPCFSGTYNLRYDSRAIY